MLEGLAKAERVLRECDCPEYITRCAHWDGLAIWLVNVADSKAEYLRRIGALFPVACPGCGWSGWNGSEERHKWWIYGPGVPSTPECYCKVELDWTGELVGLDDYDAALAAFHEAEQKLLESSL